MTSNHKVRAAIFFLCGNTYVLYDETLNLLRKAKTVKKKTAIAHEKNMRSYKMESLFTISEDFFSF